MTNPNLIPYRVSLHEEAGDTFQVMFDCQAEDDDDAETQAEKAYPNCEIINITPFPEGEPAQKYWALIDGEKLHYLGEFASFSEADDKSPANTFWIHTEDSLKLMQKEIADALASSSCEPVA